MKAVVVQADKTVKVEDKPTPKPAANEILLKVLAVGQNPTDWKAAQNRANPGDISGCDFVGEVVELGEEVPAAEVRKGEVRWGFLAGGSNPTRGAFAEYVTSEWDLTSVVPPNIKPEQAASLPIPLVTAIQALYLFLGIPEPTSEVVPLNKWILIWSGATAVGQFAIQLAKLSGLKIATTASPKRWDMLKKFGADVVVDYRDSDVVSKLKEATNDSIEYGLDCIAENGSIELTQQAFRPSGGHLTTLLFPSGELPRPEVKTETVLAYTALGKDLQFGPRTVVSPPAHRAMHAKWQKKATQLLAEGKIKPLDIEIVGGLDDVQKGFDLMRAGQHSTKLVYTVA